MSYLSVKGVYGTMTNVAVEKWTPERRRERTRTALLDAAAEVFAKRGFNGASLDEIAETAGYTRGAIYKHFEGKDDLFYAVMNRVNERSLAMFGERFAIDHEALRDVQTITQLWRDAFTLDSHLYALVLEAQLYALRNPESLERARAQRRESLDMVTRFIESQQEASGVRTKLPPREVAEIFLLASDGFNAAAHFEPHAMEAYEKFLELFIPAMIETDGD
jgi:AcrR family transcriptional regulator